MAAMSLTVEKREGFGKGPAKRLRRAGKVPAILYGEGKEPVPLQVDGKTMGELLHSAKGANTVFDLIMAGTDMRRAVMIKEIQRHPIRPGVEHCDFIRISMDRLVTVSVPVSSVGVAPGVKDFGGISEFITRQLTVECLPGDIPEQIQVDVSSLNIGDAIRVSDLKVPATYKVVDDPHVVVIHVIAPTIEKEVAVATEEAAATEPEVIKTKGKEAAEGEEAGKAEVKGKGGEKAADKGDKGDKGAKGGDKGDKGAKGGDKGKGKS